MKKFILLAGMLAFAVLLPAGSALSAYTLTDMNSVVTIDPTSSAGMYEWLIDGTDQMTQEWYWYRLSGTSPESSIDTIGNPIVTQVAPNHLKVDYSAPLFDLHLSLLLVGGLDGSGSADLVESVRISNKTKSPLEFHLFEYTNFDLNMTPADDTGIQLNSSTIKQQDGAFVATNSITGVVPIPDYWEINTVPNLVGKLNDGLATTLTNATSPTTGDIEFAFQWDFVINPYGSVFISKNKIISNVVPEPGSLAVLGCGLVGMFGFCWRRRR